MATLYIQRILNGYLKKLSNGLSVKSDLHNFQIVSNILKPALIIAFKALLYFKYTQKYTLLLVLSVAKLWQVLESVVIRGMFVCLSKV
jgi:hypothetical protein